MLVIKIFFVCPGVCWQTAERFFFLPISFYSSVYTCLWIRIEILGVLVIEWVHSILGWNLGWNWSCFNPIKEESLNPVIVLQHEYVLNPDSSFFMVNTQIAEERLEDSWVPLDETVAPEELEEMIRSKEAHTNAVILESVSPDSKSKSAASLLVHCWCRNTFCLCSWQIFQMLRLNRQKMSCLFANSIQ